MRMSSHVEVSPGGIGFVRTTAQKSIPGEPAAVKNALRQSWLADETEQQALRAKVPGFVIESAKDEAPGRRRRARAVRDFLTRVPRRHR